MDDKIVISDIEIWTRIGCTKEERDWPQKMHISLELGTDVRKTAETDSLSGAIDYAHVCQDVQSLAGEMPRVTVERLVSDVAEKIIKKYAPTSVRVVGKKYALPGVRAVSVEIFREREV